MLHIALLLFMIESDVAVFILPRLTAANFGTNGWLGFIALSLVAAFNIFMYRIVYRMGGGRSVFDIAEAAAPRAVLYPFYAALALLWLGLGAFIGKTYVLIFQMLSFQNTQPMLIYVLYCVLVLTLLTKSLYSIAKASTVFFFMASWLVLLLPYFFKSWSAVRFTTSFFQGAVETHHLSGFLEVYAAFIGYELCMFLFPHTDAKSKLFTGVFAGHFLFTAVNLLAMVMCFGFFSFEEIKRLEFPIIYMHEFVELSFLNRVDSLVYPFFSFYSLISTVMFGYAALKSIGRMLPKVSDRRLALPVTGAIFLLGFIPSIFREAGTWLKLVFTIETGVAFGMPLILIVLLKLGKKAKGA